MYCIVNLVSLIIALDIVIVLISFFFPSYSCACFLFHFFFPNGFCWIAMSDEAIYVLNWIGWNQKQQLLLHIVYIYVLWVAFDRSASRFVLSKNTGEKEKKQQINNQWQKQKNSNLMHKKCHLFTFLCACDNLVDACIFLKCPNKRYRKKSANLDELLLFVFQFDWIAASFSFEFWWFN